MSGIKPLGSEKLEGDEKIKRILEIADFRRNIKEDANENCVESNIEYTRKLPNGKSYGIVHEKNGYAIMEKDESSENFEHLDIIENRKYYKTFSKALNRINLVIKEESRLNNFEEEINLFGEQEFKLKTPAPEPEEDEEDIDDSDLDIDDSEDLDMDDSEDLDMDDSEDLDMDDSEDELDNSEEETEGEVSLKEIQRVTGTLGQLIRDFRRNSELTSGDIKYVINSIVSAIDLSKLNEEDREDVLSRLNSEMDSAGSPSDKGEDLVDDSDLDIDDSDLDIDDSDLDIDDSEDLDIDDELSEILDEDDYDVSLDLDEKECNECEKSSINEKVDFIKNKSKIVTLVREFDKFKSNQKQFDSAVKYLKENTQVDFLGKTNLGNFLFVNEEGKKVKITEKGRII